MDAENGYVRITLRDVYEKVESVGESVQTLVTESRLATRQAEDHETRIRGVERRVWALPSVATLIAIGSLLVAIFGVANGNTRIASKTRTPVAATTTTTTPSVAAQAPSNAREASLAASASPAATTVTTPSQRPSAPPKTPVPTPISVTTTVPGVLSPVLPILPAPVRSLIP